MFNTKRQIVAGDNHHYDQNKMSRCTRAKTKDGTILPCLPNWESKYICCLALAMEKEYQTLSLLKQASFHSSASFDSYRYNWLFNQTASAALAFAGNERFAWKLHTYWTNQWFLATFLRLTYYDFVHRTGWVRHKP